MHARQLRGNVEQYTGPSAADVTFGPQPRTLSPDSDDDGDGEDAGSGASWLGLLRGCLRRRDDKESLACYLLYTVVFVADMSAIALVFPAALYLYALLVNPPARRFWQVRANALRTAFPELSCQLLAALAMHVSSACAGMSLFSDLGAEPTSTAAQSIFLITCLCLLTCWMDVVQLMLVYTEAMLIAQYVFQIPTRLHCHIFTTQEQVRYVFHSHATCQWHNCKAQPTGIFFSTHDMARAGTRWEVAAQTHWCLCTPLFK